MSHKEFRSTRGEYSIRGHNSGRMGRLHNVDLVKHLSRGNYGWQQQGHKSDIVTGVGAVDRRSTVL